MPSLFGSFDGTQYDISALDALVVDLRGMSGSRAPDLSRKVQPGTFRLSVPDAESGLYVGEVICEMNGIEVHIVGARTGRPDIVEMTPEEIYGAWRQDGYAEKLRGWLGLPLPAAPH